MFIADLHIHSRFSRATSPTCEPVRLDYWARRKGLQLIASGDFTHEAYREELRDKLQPEGNGFYLLREEQRIADAGLAGEESPPRFIISGEISSIYKHNGRVRKIHNVILLPSIEAAAAVSQKLVALGCNLRADGRPIIGLPARDLLELTLDACAEAIFIPAHIWTPHFSLFGAYSGYDSLEECFGDLSGEIHALETGLSSDPGMNRRLSQLDNYALISNSDAHSPGNLAREATLFDCELSYAALYRALQTSGNPGLHGTIEFFPEEGKYHWDGHRNCHYSCAPTQTKAQKGLCPVCGGRLIVGVLHRVEELADREEDQAVQPRPYQRLIPLPEVIAACLQMRPAAKKVQRIYEKMLLDLGPELRILREIKLSEIEATASPLIAAGISRLREGRVQLAPGFDGEYGKISLFTPEELDELSGQTTLFANCGYAEKDAAVAADSPALAADGMTNTANAAAMAEQSYPYGLNQPQWQAVSATEREVAVVAGPGSGKTRTLICRIIQLLEQGVAPERIMAVTFTHKAAGELQGRLAAHFPGSPLPHALKVGTFHALAWQLLRQSGMELTLIDEYCARLLAAEAIEEQGLSLSPASFLKKFSRIKNHFVKPLSSAAGPEGEVAAPAEAELEIPQRLIDRYQGKLAEYQAADYDDLLLRAYELAEQQPDLLSGVHLLVDEFQDINPLQLRLVEAWGDKAASLFVIGDPNQSIYGFRGADAACFQRFLALHPRARRITLDENYRSAAQILACAQPLLGATQARLRARRQSPVPVRLIEAQDALGEGIAIANEIDRLIGGVDMVRAHRGKAGAAPRDLRGLSEIAVLYRTHAQAEQIGHCLSVAGIPYTVAGRENFLSDEQLRLCLSFFRALLDDGDQLSRRLAVRGLGEEQYRRLAAEFTPRVRKEKTAALVERWMEINYLDGHPALEKLRQAGLVCPSLPELLRRLLSGQEGDLSRSGGRDYAPEAVSLMTLHGAKGLEFPVVLIAGLKEGLIPLRAPGLGSDPEEEKRLLYVGMTRAEDELILLSRPERSSLLSLIPQNLLKIEQARPRLRARQLSLFDAEGKEENTRLK
ncbi:MAG: UvrD-helicase domain-containing protein [Clostridia bacterium]|nr:UvrD-helicase domain-containing protein [Clostridia bacterium]